MCAHMASRHAVAAAKQITEISPGLRLGAMTNVVVPLPESRNVSQRRDSAPPVSVSGADAQLNVSLTRGRDPNMRFRSSYTLVSPRPRTMLPIWRRRVRHSPARWGVTLGRLERRCSFGSREHRGAFLRFKCARIPGRKQVIQGTLTFRMHPESDFLCRRCSTRRTSWIGSKCL